MKYILEININTDGDFCLPFVPRGMCDDGYSHYSFCRDYADREMAIDDAINICTFLKENMKTSRDYVKTKWDTHIDSFIGNLKRSSASPHEIVEEYMFGNYDGTEWIFHAETQMLNLNLPVTDTEWDMVRRNDHHVALSDIKKAVLSLFEK